MFSLPRPRTSCAGQEQFFHRAVRADQRPMLGAVLGLDLLQAVGHVFQRGLPVDRLPLAALLEHGRGQALGAVQRFVREAVAVGQPAFVDVVRSRAAARASRGCS
jgi:hypothetical protein